MDRNELEALLNEGVARLYDRDALLLEYEVGERAIAAKLACYLSLLFPGYDVDVEYNRHGLDPKDLDLPAECHGGGMHLIVPDIIIHRRGNDESNLMVIEVKKTTNTESRACDRAKIRGMKEQFH